MKKIIYFIIVIIALGGAILYIKQDKGEAQVVENPENIYVEPVVEESKDRVESYEILEGSTFAETMTDQASTTYSEAMAIYNASVDVYDLVKVRVGRTIDLVYDKDTDELKELQYQIDSEEKLFVTLTQNASSTREWLARREDIPYKVRERVARGTVETSMYEAALENDIDIRAIIELANAFQWSVDFAMDPRVGDTFEFLYEERYLDGEYVMPGQVFAGKYVNNGTELYVYYFEESEENKGFFDENGNSVQKMFLKAPVEFRYISSGYTTGNRVVMEIGLSGPHRAIDYAAALGTPIRTVGDGVVTHAGWSSAGYGYLTKVRHNGTYSTNYAHQSKIAVSVGQRVKQGEVIGYVGSTGYSTGPHLHYEMVKNGVKINPQNEILPPGDPIKEENLDRYFELKTQYDEKLKQE
ncbi:hypothetical protein C0583_04755 [Candidatus Parcubacteria bacterium]|nr:MAG: hypothetical protein C0583_04755 [Candidatus Parcubacteria bacterium]